VAKKEPVPLNEFAKNSRRGPNRWVDQLPEDILKQIDESNAGAAIIARWLVSLGYTDAKKHHLDPYVADRNNARS